jgi:hypothetical protein
MSMPVCRIAHHIVITTSEHAVVTMAWDRIIATIALEGTTALHNRNSCYSLGCPAEVITVMWSKGHLWTSFNVHFANSFTCNQPAEWSYVWHTCCTAVTVNFFAKRKTYQLLWCGVPFLKLVASSGGAQQPPPGGLETKFWEFFYRLAWMWNSKQASFVSCIISKV